MPSRSDATPTLVQKQVGQTRVQLAQRQAALGDLGPARMVERAARAVRSRPVGRHPIARRAPATTSAAASAARRLGGCELERRDNAAPAGDPVRTTKPVVELGRRHVEPVVASGPVPIEVQKQVDVGVAHSTATTRADARRAW